MTFGGAQRPTDEGMEMWCGCLPWHPCGGPLSWLLGQELTQGTRVSSTLPGEEWATGSPLEIGAGRTVPQEQRNGQGASPLLGSSWEVTAQATKFTLVKQTVLRVLPGQDGPQPKTLGPCGQRIGPQSRISQDLLGTGQSI